MFCANSLATTHNFCGKTIAYVANCILIRSGLLNRFNLDEKHYYPKMRTLFDRLTVAQKMRISCSRI
jgi:hypothetical protein